MMTLTVSELVERGGTIGCFQIESPGMRATLREIQARCEADLMAALALYRPGPLTGGLKDAFVRRHRGLEEPEQLHPALHSCWKIPTASSCTRSRCCASPTNWQASAWRMLTCCAGR
jgi:hypothetical protein